MLLTLSTGVAATEIKECKYLASSPLASGKSDGGLSSKQVQEMGDKVEYTDCDPNSQGSSLNDACVVNSLSDDGRVRASTELAVKSSDSELEQTGDAPSDSSGSSQEVAVKPVPIPPAEDSSKPIENGDTSISYGMKVEASCNQSMPLLEGSSTENSKEVVETNDAQSPFRCMPQPDLCHSALEMEEQPRQVMKEEGTMEEMDLKSVDVSLSPQGNEADPMLVNSALNCQVTQDDGSQSDEPADDGKGPPQDMVVGNKSVLSYESEGDLPSSTDSKSDDANEVN